MERLNMMMTIDDALSKGKKQIAVGGMMFLYDKGEVGLRDIDGQYITLGKANSATQATILIMEKINQTIEV